MTEEDKAILAHVVINPDEWVAHAIATVGEQAITDKIIKYRESYLAEKDTLGYLTRKQREELKNGHLNT